MLQREENDGIALRGSREQTGRRLGLAAALLIVLALLVAACGSAAEPAAVPTAMPTSPPAPKETPVAETMTTPAVTVAAQEIVDGKVTIAEVVSDGPGWLVIHGQADGKPGSILGYSPVADGANADMVVEIDTANATETLYAMLHTDAGDVGTWEFPDGPDAPVKVGEQIVTPAFNVTAGLATAEEAVTPSVAASDQAILDGRVTLAEVVSDGPGWLVIHARSDGKPGSILGYSPVADGTNGDVAVELDLALATSELYAMLHTDAGDVGVWEFPDGPDTPVKQGEAIVMTPFSLEIAEGEVEVAMTGFKFDPPLLVVNAGTTVTWINNDGAVEHDVESDAGIWHSDLFAGGGSFSYAFDEPGVYAYHCDPHGDVGGKGMAGTIIVLN